MHDSELIPVDSFSTSLDKNYLFPGFKTAWRVNAQMAVATQAGGSGFNPKIFFSSTAALSL